MCISCCTFVISEIAPPSAAFGARLKDTVIAGKTGVFFAQQTEADLIDAIARFEMIEASFDARTLREHAATFSREAFRHKMALFIDAALREKKTAPRKTILAEAAE